MAHFAEIDSDNKLKRVIVTRDDYPNEGYDWLLETLGGTWVKTSYNTSGGVHYTDGEPSTDQSKALRFNYAGIGFTYDENRDAFIPPQPYASWVLDEDTCLWVAPIAYPAEGNHVWDEETGDWVEVTDETL